MKQHPAHRSLGRFCALLALLCLLGLPAVPTASASDVTDAPKLFKSYRYGMTQADIAAFEPGVGPCEETAGFQAPDGWLCNPGEVRFAESDWLQVFAMDGNGLNEVRLLTTFDAPTVEKLFAALKGHLPVMIYSDNAIKDVFTVPDRKKFLLEDFPAAINGSNTRVVLMAQADFKMLLDMKGKNLSLFERVEKRLPEARFVTVNIFSDEEAPVLLVNFSVDVWHAKHLTVKKEEF